MGQGPPVLGVHGIWNFADGLTPEAASTRLAEKWRKSLAAGYRDAGIADPPPEVVAAYYAHHLNAGSQGAADQLESLSPAERLAAWKWMLELGVPAGAAAQGRATTPLRQGLSWLAGQRGVAAQTISRVMIAFLREVFVYMTRPTVRDRAQGEVIALLRNHRPRVVVAHSLGSVVAYEALHRAPDVDVDLFLTLGSPLGLPEAVFEGLAPEPQDGRGLRPPSVRRWVNIADVGDIVATPRWLGNKFDVDLHDEVSIGAVDFHTFGGYLSSGLVAGALLPYV